MRELVKVYKVLSDESRLRGLNLLLERPSCVCEVMQALEVSQSKASRILSMLYDAGILTVRREGLWAVYSIDWEGMDPAIRDIVQATTKASAGKPQMAADRERLRQAERVGPGCVKDRCATKTAA